MKRFLLPFTIMVLVVFAVLLGVDFGDSGLFKGDFSLGGRPASLDEPSQWIRSTSDSGRLQNGR